MEDFERVNARKWDLHATPSRSHEGAPVTPLPASSTHLLAPPPQAISHSRSLSNPNSHDSPSHKAPRKYDQRRYGPVFEHVAISEGEASWRLGEAPSQSMMIPVDIVFQRRDDLNNMARNAGIFIFAWNRHQLVNGKIKHGVWGLPAAASAVCQIIEGWARDLKAGESSTWMRKSKASPRKWARLTNLTPKLLERAGKEWDRDIKRQLFSQQPNQDMRFSAVGSFLWPVDEYAPDEVLGNAYEALDPIRMDAHCYIVFKKEKDYFQVMSTSRNLHHGSERVQEALVRLREACFQIAARQNVPVKAFLLQWKDPLHIVDHVKTDPYVFPQQIPHDVHPDIGASRLPEISARKQQPARDPSLWKGSRPDQEHLVTQLLDTVTRRDSRGYGVTVGNALLGQGAFVDTTKLESASRLPTSNTVKVRESIMRVIRRLEYYRGSLQMRIRLGTFIAERPKKPLLGEGICTLAGYESMISESQFRAFVTREIGDAATEDGALGQLQQAVNLLDPQDAITKTLSEVQPVYTAVFVIDDEAGDLRLVVTFAETRYNNQRSEFGVISRKWTRLDRHSKAPDRLLDISVTDLADGSAWQFDITACQSVEDHRLSPELIAFADSVCIDGKVANKEATCESFVRRHPLLALKSFRQSTTYQYYIRGTDYTIELSRFQDYRKLAPGPEMQAYEPRCGVNVYRKQWDTWFTGNEHLPIGMGVDWSPHVESWFPEDVVVGAPSLEESEPEAGFAAMMEKLRMVEGLLKPAKKANNGGMTVG